VVLWKKCDDPLLFLERKTYLEAMQNGLANLDDARVVLAQARRRLLDGRSPGKVNGVTKG
jgi:hypothetical protein